MFLDFLFGRKNGAPAPGPSAPAPAAAQAAPGTSIHYSPDLVAELKADHAALLKLFGQIQAAHAAGQLPETAGLLEKFRSLLIGHLLKENVRFYIYLEHALAGDASSNALVHQFRQEMDAIGKAALAFLEKYRHIAANPALAGSFAADLGAIGKVLVERVRNEEGTLYPLYLPVY